MRRFLLPLLSLAVAAGLLAAPASALMIQTDDELFFDEYATQDLYLAGVNVTVQQDVEGDVWVAGGTVTLNGAITGDLVVAGGTVTVNGAISDDVRVVGGSVTLNGPVGGDLVLIGGSADVADPVVVQGDVLSLAGVLNLYGDVNRSLSGIFGRLTVGGEVRGDARVRVTESLVLLKTGHLLGNLDYFAPSPLENHNGLIDGTIAFNEILSSGEKVRTELKQWMNRGYLAGKLWSFFSLLLIGALLLLIFPHLLPRSAERLRSSWVKSFGLGFLVFVLGGTAVALSLLTLVGAQLGFMIAALLFVVGEIGRLVSAYWLSTVVIRHDSLKRTSPKGKVFLIHLGMLALGLLLIKAVGAIPYLGLLAGFVFFVVGVGAFYGVMRDNVHHLLKEKML